MFYERAGAAAPSVRQQIFPTGIPITRVRRVATIRKQAAFSHRDPRLLNLGVGIGLRCARGFGKPRAKWNGSRKPGGMVLLHLIFSALNQFASRPQRPCCKRAFFATRRSKLASLFSPAILYECEQCPVWEMGGRVPRASPPCTSSGSDNREVCASNLTGKVSNGLYYGWSSRARLIATKRKKMTDLRP